MKKLSIIIIFFSQSALSSSLKKPLYEFGFAGFMAQIPDYPASDQTHTRSLAVPTFVYRGFIFRSDDKGARARFFKSDDWDIDLSLGAALPSSSDNNDARSGMDDLDTLLELGPRANYQVLKTQRSKIDLEFPTRLVISTDSQHTQQRGVRFAPEIEYKYQVNERYKISTSMRFNYGSQNLNDYFYSVSSSDTTKSRALYKAQAGYMGRDFNFNIINKREHLSVIFGIRHSNYEGSNNQKSPLFKSKEDSSVYLGFNYFYYQSKKMSD